MPDRSSFDFDAVTRRARREGMRAGRADGLGRPLADTLEQLPARRWIKERFDEFIGEDEHRLVSRRRLLNEQVEVHRERVRAVADEIAEAQARVDELAPAREADRAKPRHQQDLGLEYALGHAEQRRRRGRVREHELTLELRRLEEQLAEVDHEFTASPTRLCEKRDSIEHEHDIAFARGRQSWRVSMMRWLHRAPGARMLLGRAEA